MAAERVYEAAIRDAIDRMDRAGLSLRRSADELVQAGFDLVAECAGTGAARRWAREHLQRLEREGVEGDWRLRLGGGDDDPT